MPMSLLWIEQFADGHVIGLVDPHAGAVVAGVVGPGQFETFQRAVVGSRVELEDGPRRAAGAAVVESLPADRHVEFARCRERRGR